MVILDLIAAVFLMILRGLFVVLGMTVGGLMMFISTVLDSLSRKSS